VLSSQRSGIQRPEQAAASSSHVHGQYMLHTWGGRLRGVPSSFRLNRSSKLLVLWKRWWTGEHGTCMPYRLVFESYKADIMAALEFQNKDDDLPKQKRLLRATLNEHLSVMRYLTSLISSEQVVALKGYCAANLETMPVLQSRMQEAWDNLWPKFEENVGFNAEWRQTTFGGRSQKRRKHDLTRCTVRTAYRLITQMKKHEQ